MKKILGCLSLVCILGVVTSCSGDASFSRYTAKIEITKEGSTGNGVINPNDVKITETYHSLEDKRYYNTQVLPSIGDVKLLVIPILIPGYDSFTYYNFDEDVTVDEKLSTVKNDIEKTFFGKEDETGWQSVSSFYEKSSFGKLKLSGTVTDWFDASSVDGVDAANSITIEKTYEVVEEAVNWALATQDINAADYDYDNDGFIDGVWCVYSAEDYSKGGPMTDDQNYWAYTTWGNQDKQGNPANNEYYYNLFGWASYDFMYEGYGVEKLDAHTYIHETGHFLGLNDYYSDRTMYNPVGKVDMMDANIIDHNSYSKMLLGWTKPYVVYGNATIDLKSMQNENNLIVVLSDNQKVENNEFDPFGEYMLIELYSNEGLNLKDSETKLSDDRPLASEQGGIRIYHIDNRKFVVSEQNGLIVTEEYKDQTIDENNRVIIPITNSISYNQYYYNLNLDGKYYPYDEIRMIEASGKNTFSTGGVQTQKTFFKEGDVFTLASYSEFFLNLDKFNNGDAFTSSIKVSSLVDKEAK